MDMNVTLEGSRTLLAPRAGHAGERLADRAYRAQCALANELVTNPHSALAEWVLETVRLGPGHLAPSGCSLGAFTSCGPGRGIGPANPAPL